MVAKITTPHSILRVLNYNEKKVQKQKAECMYAGNYLPDAKDLNFNDKLHTFKKRIELNTRSKTNTLHISLNFDPSEKLSKEKLIEIACIYMEKIGFGNQPYLVYQHHDAGHPHIHIVTTSILENGKRIDTYNIGKNQSEKARKEIENIYQLIKARGRNSEWKKDIEPVNVQKIKYGTTETKRSIINVLDNVLTQYKFTSIAELNVVLRLYNIIADRGSEGGRIYKNRGLTYRILDGNTKIGIPIKASSIYFKPTLHFLEEKFKQNESLRLPHKQKLKTTIDWTLAKRPKSLSEFILQLQREKISVTLRRNDNGFLYGITFVDHRTKCVFNGSDLGKSYSAASIQKRLSDTNIQKENPLINLLQKKGSIQKDIQENKNIPDKKDIESLKSMRSKNENLLELLLKQKNDNRFQYEFLKKKKKRRKTN